MNAQTNAATPDRDNPGPQPSDKYDRNSPAYRIIYGVWGSQLAFSKETGIPLSNVNRYLQSGLILAKRQGDVLRAARENGRELDPLLFVPTASQA